MSKEVCQADADRAAAIIARAVALLSVGQARGWSHAVSIARKEQTSAQRLAALGATPVQPTPVAQQSPATPARAAQNGAQRVTPIYDDSGEALCPVHKKPLVEGSYGLYCKSKAQPGDKQNDKGYCSLKFD